ncbi:MAG: S8 family serine peptidase [Deltaproteobacteria bacterium]|nr:S8 family serine peptidase [Deltaproteobacteria bacterium]
MYKLLALASVVGLLGAGAAMADKGVDPFRHGVPQARVPGVALLKLRDFRAQELVAGRQRVAAAAALKELAQRSDVVIELIRPTALGWAFVEIRDGAAPEVIPDEARTLALIERLAADPAVAAAAQDTWMRALRTPNDPGFDQMWHLTSIGAPAAWDRTTGISTQRVGIVDTGLVRAHEDVGTRAVAGYDFVSSTSSSTDGNGRDADYNDTGDDCGGGSSYHGTHVAGTIGARADNSTGIPGLNWNAGLVIGRALGACGGDIVDIGDAAMWMAGGNISGVTAIGANKVSVMNLSLGSDAGCSSYEQDMVDFVNQQGTIFVAAAGNSSGPVGSPANCNGSIAVAAHGPQNSLTSYSSFGSEVAIVAPGGDFSSGEQGGVLSSIGPTSSGYAFNQGTSMASPHVAGAVSLMQALDATLTRAEIVSLLQANGEACSGCGSKVAMKLDATLAAIGGGTTPPPPPPPPPTTGDDDLEENDAYDDAKGGVACGDDLDLMALPTDQDWFLVQTGAGATIDITISASNGADLDLYVLDGPTSQDVIAASESATGNEAVQVTGTGSPLHVLVVPYVDTQSGTEHTGPYAITVTCVGGEPPPADPTDPPSDPTDPTDPPSDPSDPPVGPDPDAIEDQLEDNDTAADAAEMYCDEERALTLKDDDYFTVTVRDHDDLVALIDADELELTVEIMDMNGEVIAEGDSENLASASDLAAGSYVVGVHPTSEFGSYRLQTRCKALEFNPLVEAGCSSSGGVAPMAGALGLLALLARRRRR